MASSQQPSTSGRALVAYFSTGSAQPSLAVATLAAELRAEAGSIPAGKLRRAGRTPAVLFSQPGSADPGAHTLLSLDAKVVAKAVQRLGRAGWACSVFQLEIAGNGGGGAPQRVRALGRQVHMRADTDAIENVTFIACPSERLVKVDVPLRVIGEEVCPGLKTGGRVNWIRRSIPCVARGDAIPGAFEVDISGLALNQKLYFSHLALPAGVALRVKDTAAPIIKIAK